MYFRKRTSGGRAYLQIVESRREGAAVRQQVIATLGRVEDLRESGQLERLLRSAPLRRQSHCRRRRRCRRGDNEFGATHRAGAGVRTIVGGDGLPGSDRNSRPARAIMISRWSARCSSPFCIACFRAAPTGRRIGGGWITGSGASRASICIIFTARWLGSAGNWRKINRTRLRPSRRVASKTSWKRPCSRGGAISSARSIWCSWTTSASPSRARAARGLDAAAFPRIIGQISTR